MYMKYTKEQQNILNELKNKIAKCFREAQKQTGLKIKDSNKIIVLLPYLEYWDLNVKELLGHKVFFTDTYSNEFDIAINNDWSDSDRMCYINRFREAREFL